MRLGLKTILLGGAVLLFVVAALVEENSFDLLAIGLALFAGALLLEDLGIRGPRRGPLRR